nr:hypothetical protein CFP56_38798 [Quercus suber]
MLRLEVPPATETVAGCHENKTRFPAVANVLFRTSGHERIVMIYAYCMAKFVQRAWVHREQPRLSCRRAQVLRVCSDIWVSFYFLCSIPGTPLLSSRLYPLHITEISLVGFSRSLVMFPTFDRTFKAFCSQFRSRRDLRISARVSDMQVLFERKVPKTQSQGATYLRMSHRDRVVPSTIRGLSLWPSGEHYGLAGMHTAEAEDR